MSTTIFFQIVEVFLGIFICSGNILTIIAVWKSPKLRTIPNMYVISLAVADLIMGGIVMPFYFVMDFGWAHERLKTEKYLCLFRFVPFSISAGCSIMNMVLIAMDRCVYIAYPLHYERLVTDRTAKISIAFMWVISVLMALLLFLDHTWKPYLECTIYNALSMEYMVINRGAALFLCCMVILIIYIFIIYVARKQQCLVRRYVGKNKNQRADDIKLIKLFGLVFGIFFLCWCPLLVVLPLPYFGIKIPANVTHVSFMVATLNSGMNFIVYVIFNKDYRREILKLIGWKLSNNVVQVEPAPKETVA